MSSYESKYLDYDHYGLPVWVDGETGSHYAIAPDRSDAEYAAREYIRLNLWKLDSSFILKFIEAAEELSDFATRQFQTMIEILQAQLREDANEDLLKLVGYE